jgi:hypothetical protein
MADLTQKMSEMTIESAIPSIPEGPFDPRFMVHIPVQQKLPAQVFVRRNLNTVLLRVSFNPSFFWDKPHLFLFFINRVSPISINWTMRKKRSP